MISILDKEILSEEDIKLLISLKVEESINLDFKQSPALEKNDKRKVELVKDVSSFANSAGGIIVYGIKEINHAADELSFINGNEITKEWIEQVIQTGIQPKIEGLKILPIRFNNEVGKTIYVIKIPESRLAPHMTSDKRFYKRYNFESTKMEEYEIRNLYNRVEKTKLVIGVITTSTIVSFENKGMHDETEFQRLGFQIENIGMAIEKYFKLNIIFNFSEYVIHFDPLIDNKPNYFLNADGTKGISFSNNSPIFPNEVLTIGSIEFGIKHYSKQAILENGKFRIILNYSNGMEEIEYKVRDLLKLTI